MEMCLDTECGNMVKWLLPWMRVSCSPSGWMGLMAGLLGSRVELRSLMAAATADLELAMEDDDVDWMKSQRHD